MKDHKEITIYDIATRLGLSPATVSRALKDNPSISKATRLKVNELAIELGYRSNMVASNLRSKKTQTIGVIVQKLDSHFIASVLAGMEKVANEEGYNLIISQSLERVEKEIANAKTMYNNRVDGLLASLSTETETIEHFEQFIQKGIPLVFFDRVFKHDQALSIVIDNYKNGFEATSHLIKQGCGRVMHITGSLKRNVYADRFRGYKDALEEAGIPFTNDLLLLCNMDEESGTVAAEKILKLKKKPDGLFIAGDACAAFCLKKLKNSGINIPKDIAIVGFNDDPISFVSEPALSTVHYPGKDIGAMAMKHLIAHLKGTYDMNATNTIVLRSELVIRESSLKNKY